MAVPVLLYVKLAGVAALVAGTAWAAWAIRDASAEEDKQEAVREVVRATQRELDRERELRSHYQKLSDNKLSDVLNSIANIRVEHKTVTNNITREREVHKEFYMQPLPPGGYEQWLRARSLALPASSPSR